MKPRTGCAQEKSHPIRVTKRPHSAERVKASQTGCASKATPAPSKPRQLPRAEDCIYEELRRAGDEHDRREDVPNHQEDAEWEKAQPLERDAMEAAAVAEKGARRDRQDQTNPSRQAV